MSSADLQLAEDEEVLFEESPAVLTSRRLMVHRTLKGEPRGWEEYAWTTSPFSRRRTVATRVGSSWASSWERPE